MGKVYKGDYGVQVRVKTGIDLTGVQTKLLIVSKPDSRKVSWTPTVESPAQNGILAYTTIQGDFDVAGSYKLQAKVTFSGAQFLGETAVFKIYEEQQ